MSSKQQDVKGGRQLEKKSENVHVFTSFVKENQQIYSVND